MSSESRIVPTRGLDASTATTVKNPYGPEGSEVQIHALSMRAGLSRQVVNLGRLPPGNTSFVPHAHMTAEEFIFVLEGEGVAVIGEDEFPIGPGDFIGYPCDGAAHQLRNTGDRDIVYLMGGERPKVDVVRFPTLDKVGVFSSDGIQMLDEKTAEHRTFEEYVVKP